MESGALSPSMGRATTRLGSKSSRMPWSLKVGVECSKSQDTKGPPKKKTMSARKELQYYSLDKKRRLNIGTSSSLALEKGRIGVEIPDVVLSISIHASS